MCYWVREHDRRRDIAGGELPAKPSFIRPSVVGAVAVALVALTAAAALSLATSTPAVSSEKAALTTVAARTTEPAGPVFEQTATAVDDGVPSSQRAGGHCDHGL